MAFQGDARGSLARYLRAHLVVSVDTLDKVMGFIRPFAVLSPEIAKAVLAVSVAKGMAKTGSDGRLVWDIEFNGPPTEVSINGVPIPLR